MAVPTARCTEVAWDSATIVSLTGCLPIFSHQTYGSRSGGAAYWHFLLTPWPVSRPQNKDLKVKTFIVY